MKDQIRRLTLWRCGFLFLCWYQLFAGSCPPEKFVFVPYRGHYIKEAKEIHRLNMIKLDNRLKTNIVVENGKH
jgi:hypothetical protein